MCSILCRYLLGNLKAGVSYTVEIFPYSGSDRGRPAIVKIPASQTRTGTVSSAVWQMQIPEIRADSVTLMWTTPWYGSNVEGKMGCETLKH